MSGIWDELPSLLLYRNKSSLVLDFCGVTLCHLKLTWKEVEELNFVIQLIYHWKQEVVMGNGNFCPPDSLCTNIC